MTGVICIYFLRTIKVVNSTLALAATSSSVDLICSISSLTPFFNLFPLLILSSHPLFKKTRLSTDPDGDRPGPDSYTLMEDGHVSINDNYTEEQPTRTRAHTTI